MTKPIDDRTEGYVIDLAYLHNFLPGLAPINLALAAVMSGVRAPDVDAPFAYLDLGCGNGFTPALLAAANPHGAFWGNDVNPAHIRNARATTAAAEVPNATFVEATFADLLDADLPAFDFVAIHGIWSWVSQANRDRIAELLAHRVKPGGLVLVTYNCHPGWDPLLPLRRLMLGGRGATSLERIHDALATAQRLRDAGADYFRNNAPAAAALDQIAGAHPGYLAHEYLNADWTVFHPREVAAALAPAGLSYVGQAKPFDTLDACWLTADQRALVAGEPDPAAAEALRDLIVDRRFRRDLFVRDAMPIDADEVAAWFAERRFVLARPRAACGLAVETRVGDFTLPSPLCDALLDTLAHGSATGAALAAATGQDVAEALGLLAAVGHVLPALDAAGEPARRASTDRFNDAALAAARCGDPVAALASPISGSGVSVAPGEQFLLDAARFGLPFGDGDDPAAIFARERLPVLAMLGIG